jgi:hypothetical protein
MYGHPLAARHALVQHFLVECMHETIPCPYGRVWPLDEPSFLEKMSVSGKFCAVLFDELKLHLPPGRDRWGGKLHAGDARHLEYALRCGREGSYLGLDHTVQVTRDRSQERSEEFIRRLVLPPPCPLLRIEVVNHMPQKQRVAFCPVIHRAYET